jgi:hypothetical protein
MGWGGYDVSFAALSGMIEEDSTSGVEVASAVVGDTSGLLSSYFAPGQFQMNSMLAVA